ncbi:MAG: GLPGLI family protein [Muribaculaceae bacterium]|nr:GLPGLI family protein [Muribaculaceae bacterium]MDE6754700.1 GLPGLI family protein [Muribaculaceae bacterium]
MNRLICIVLFIITIGLREMLSASIIEPKEPGILEVHYTKIWTTDTLTRAKSKSHSEPTVLRIGKTSAMFYPEKAMWWDSLRINDSEKAYELQKATAIARNLAHPYYANLGGKDSEYVFRNIKPGMTQGFFSIGSEKSTYIEPTEYPVWEIDSLTKEVLGYECIHAKCSFRGREWDAWFTPEIPYKEGPWKLAGLPGLILEAYDTNMDYHYIANSILTENLKSVGIFYYCRSDPFFYKSRQNMLKKNYRERLQGNRTFQLQLNYGSKDRTYKPVIWHYDFQETDYPHE